MNENCFWMRKAIECGRQAEKAGEIPIGAVLICDDKLISSEHNRPIANRDPTAHAEIMVLRSAAAQLDNYRILNSTLYVTLEPCVMCVGAMIHARIKRLVFGAYDSKFGAIVSRSKLLDESHFNHRIEYIGGILADECKALLTDFFQKRRK